MLSALQQREMRAVVQRFSLASLVITAALAAALSPAAPLQAQTPPPAGAAPALPTAPAPSPSAPPAAPATPPPDAAVTSTPASGAGPGKSAPPPSASLPNSTNRVRGSATVEQHISRLHSALKITPAQQAKWDAFAQVMRDNAAHMDSVAKAHPRHASGENAVDGLKSYEAITQAHLEDLQKLEPAFETLYNAMSDSQKKVADGMFRTPPRQARATPAAPATSTE